MADVKKKNLLLEIASLDKAHDVFSFLTQRTSDKIITERGRGTLDYYDTMTDSDPILAGLLETRVDAVSGQEWDVVAGGTEDLDVKLSDFVHWALDHLPRFKQDLSQILSACRTGFSISEIVWDLVDYEGQQKYVPVQLLSRRPERFTFNAAYELQLKTRGDSFEGVAVPDHKFIHHIFRPRYENPYGTSLCTSIYWYWWFKRHGMAWWLKAAERGAVITPVGKYPEHYNEDEIQQFREALKLFQGDSYIAAREGTEIEFPQIKIDPEFASALRDACNEEMIYRILGATQSSGGGDEGSKAKAIVHDRRFQERVEADSEAVMATLNEQLIASIVLLNYPVPKEMPKWKLIYDLPKDTKTIAEVLEKAAKMAIPIAVSDAAELLDLPMADPDETDLIQAPKSGFGEDDTSEETEIEPAEETEDTTDVDEDTSDSAVKPLIISYATRQRVTKYITTMDNLADAALKYSKPTINSLIAQITVWLSRFETIEQAVANTKYFKLDVTKFQNYLLNARFNSLLHGFFDFVLSPGEASKARFNIKQIFRQKFIPLPPEEAIAQFSDHKILEREEFDMLFAHERRAATTAANMSAETIESKLQPALMEALVVGTTISQFKKQVKDIVLSPAHAENIFRTNINSAYNNGHMEGMFYPGYEETIAAVEFIATMDDRTTTICSERHGQLYSLDMLKNGGIAPPLHFMCRSTVIEVFEDELNGRTLNKELEIAPQEGFGDFTNILSKLKPVEYDPGIISFKNLLPNKSEMLIEQIKKQAEELADLTRKTKKEAGAVINPNGSLFDRTDIGEENKVVITVPKYSDFLNIHTHPSFQMHSTDDIGNVLMRDDSGQEVASIVLAHEELFIVRANEVFFYNLEDMRQFADELFDELSDRVTDRMFDESDAPTDEDYERIYNDELEKWIAGEGKEKYGLEMARISWEVFLSAF